MIARRGYRAYVRPTAPPAAYLEAASRLSVASIADAMFGMGVMDPAISPLAGEQSRIVGPAVTADLTPGDGMVLRAAIQAAGAGDVLVVNGSGESNRAILGANLVLEMIERGVQGCVVDGYVRDLAEIRALGFPLFALGRTPRSGTTDAGHGEVNCPIACGRVVVLPGDIVVADTEGIVVVPMRDAPSVLGRAEISQAEMETRRQGGNAAFFEARWRKVRATLETQQFSSLDHTWDHVPGAADD